MQCQSNRRFVAGRSLPLAPHNNKLGNRTEAGLTSSFEMLLSFVFACVIRLISNLFHCLFG
jgi:hypothetical protein